MQLLRPSCSPGAMLKQLCVTLAIALPCWALACSSDAPISPDSSAAGAGQGGAAPSGAAGAAGEPGHELPAGAGGAGGEPASGGAGGSSQSGANAGGEAPGDGGAPSALECGADQICFFLDDGARQKAGGGYRLTHATLGPSLFVKYEDGAVQLSIEIYSVEPGTFEVLDVPTAGAARVAWYENDAQGQHIYQGRSGTVTVSEIDDEFFVTGSFAAELELTENDAYTGDTRSVTAGTFSHVYLREI